MKSKTLHTCCFFGHRKIDITEKLKTVLYQTVEDLIVNREINTFLFGSKSEFDSLCLEVVTKLKEKHPHIKRIYVRAEYPYIDDFYKKHLLKFYDDTYFPDGMENAGKAVYVERNIKMINNSNICIAYYNPRYAPPSRKNSSKDFVSFQPKSGTKLAYEYALKKKVEVINIYILLTSNVVPR